MALLGRVPDRSYGLVVEGYEVFANLAKAGCLTRRPAKRILPPNELILDQAGEEIDGANFWGWTSSRRTSSATTTPEQQGLPRGAAFIG